MSQSNACTIVLPGKADRIYVDVRLYAGERYYDAKALWDIRCGFFTPLSCLFLDFG